MKIVIEVIPHHEQRYATLGDYWVDVDGVQQVRVSDLGNPHMNILVALHELIELTLCEARGIAEPDIKAFDEAHPDADDPGSLPDAPYGLEHRFAEKIEYVMAGELNVTWTDYEARCKAMFE